MLQMGGHNGGVHFLRATGVVGCEGVSSAGRGLARLQWLPGQAQPYRDGLWSPPRRGRWGGLRPAGGPGVRAEGPCPILLLSL